MARETRWIVGKGQGGNGGGKGAMVTVTFPAGSKRHAVAQDRPDHMDGDRHGTTACGMQWYTCLGAVVGAGAVDCKRCGARKGMDDAQQGKEEQ